MLEEQIKNFEWEMKNGFILPQNFNIFSYRRCLLEFLLDPDLPKYECKKCQKYFADERSFNGHSKMKHSSSMDVDIETIFQKGTFLALKL